MSLFQFLGNIFKPAADLIDNVHTSVEEKLTLQNQLAQIEAQVSVKLMELQAAVLEANAKVAVSEQQHGNWLSKSWRPIVSLALTGMLVAMGMGYIPFNQMLAQIGGGFLGIYGIGRSLEKRSK